MGPPALKAADPSDALSTHYIRRRGGDTDKYVTTSLWAEFESVSFGAWRGAAIDHRLLMNSLCLLIVYSSADRLD